MITVTQTRHKDGEFFNQPAITFDDPLEALGQLVDVELKWGGQITSVDETSLLVITRVMGCIDSSHFQGETVEEMKPLLELAYYHLQAGTHDELLRQHAAQIFMEKTGGNPGLLKLIAPLLVGGSHLRLTTMLACGITEEEDLKAGMETRGQLKDIIAAIQLMRDGTCSSFRESLELAE
jgi:hypothetical protein